MKNPDSVVAVFANHAAAEAAIKKLSGGGFDITKLSVVGKGYHVDEQVVGFYNQDDRIRFWGSRGAFWGGLWSLFFGGMFMTIPLVGPVVVLGYLGTLIIGAIEGAVLVGGVSAISAALYGMGIPRDSVLQYEKSITNDDFLVMVHDTPGRVALARDILRISDAVSVDIHAASPAPEHVPEPVVAGA